MTESNVSLHWISIPAQPKANNARAWVEVDQDTGEQVLRAWITETAQGDYAGMYVHGPNSGATTILDSEEACISACVAGWKMLYAKTLDEKRKAVGN
ncbi:hypothetical protein [Dyella sp.]|uniref:hypothetical protein n=1 Tax=Dyella sp. TaxID=1869338 RepID=UPI002849D201|nr:hypothetical protein [Dyella sp.]MDR3445736.1 hypothetical protein [Dyella sp.]